MADETIGSLGVDITGDWSALQDAMDQAVLAASAGADKIASAFSASSASTDEATSSIQQLADASGLAGGQLQIFQAVLQSGADSGISLTQSLTDMAASASTVGSAVADAAQQLLDEQQAADQAATATESLGAAADTTTGSVGQLGGGLQSIGAAAEDGATGMDGMVQQLTLLGEALAITDGLKDFAESALSASANVQTVTVALTALTGSAQTADSVISQIRDLAQQEPFKFPDLEASAQQMVALGVNAANVVPVLRSLADSASATGFSLSTVVSLFDRLSESGVVMTRSLATLGINWEDLRKALGDFGVSVDDTSKAVTAAFKDLPDEAARVQVLTDAVSKFAGDGKAQVQALGGQWITFQNQITTVMQEIGDAIAPAAIALMNAFRDVIPFVQNTVQWFQQLPAPVKDVALAVAALAAAVVPLTGLLAGVGLAIIGLQGVMPALTGIMGAFGTASAAAGVSLDSLVVAEGAQTVAAANAGTATEAAAVQMGLFDTATVAASAQLDLFATGTLVDAARGWSGLEAGAVAASDSLLSQLIPSLSSAAKGLTVLSVIAAGFSWGYFEGGIKDASAQLDAMSGFARTLGLNFQQASASGNDFGIALSKLQTLAQQDGIVLDQGGMSAQQYAVALLKLVQAHEAVTGATATTTGAATNLATAENALIGKLKEHEAAVANDKAAIDDINNSLATGAKMANGMVASAADLSAAQKKLASDTKTLDTALGEHNTVLGLSAAQWAKIDKEAAGFQEASGGVPELIDSINQQVEKQDDAFTGAVAAWVALSTTAGSSAGAINLASQRVQQAIAKMGGVTEADTMAAVQKSFTAMGKSADDLIAQMQKDATEFGTSSDQFQNDTSLLSGYFGGDMKAMQQAVQDFADKSTTSLGTLVPVLQNGKTVWTQYGSGVDDANQAASTGYVQIQGLFDVVKNGAAVVQEGARYFNALDGNILAISSSGVQVGGELGALYNVIKGGSGIVQQATGDMTNFGQSHLSAADKAQQLAEQTGNATGKIIDLTNYVHSATQDQNNYASSVQATTDSYGDLQKQITDLMQTFTNTGDPAIMVQIQKLEAEAAAAENATAALGNLSAAQSKLSTKAAANSGNMAGVSNASGIMSGTGVMGGVTNTEGAAASGYSMFGPGGSLFGPGMWSNNAGAAMPGGTSMSSETPSQQYADQMTTAVLAFEQSMGIATPTVNKTTTAVQTLDHALEGGSLRPSLDLTTASVKVLDAQLGTAQSSTGVLSSSVANLIKAMTAPAVVGPSAGDPLSEGEIAALAAGQTLNNSLQLTAAQMVAVNADVSNFTDNMAAYTAQQSSYNEAVDALNSSTAIIAATTTATTGSTEGFNSTLAQNVTATNDLNTAVGSLALTQASTASDATTLTTNLSSLGTQLDTATSDGYQYAQQLAALDQAGQGATDQAQQLSAALAVTNTASDATQQNMGELADELAAVQQGGTAAMGAAEYLATAFGSDTSGLTGAMNANALITGVSNVATGDLTQAVGTLASSATGAANSISAAAQQINSANALITGVSNVGNGELPPSSSGGSSLDNQSYNSAIAAGLSPAQAQAIVNSINSSVGNSAAGAPVAESSSSLPGGVTQATWNGQFPTASPSTDAVTTSIAPLPGAPGANGAINVNGLSQSQINSISAAGLGMSPAEYENTVLGGENPADWTRPGTSFTLGGNSAGAGGIGGVGSAPSGSPITINISGMTPGNAQYVQDQMVTQLRQLGLKI